MGPYVGLYPRARRVLDLCDLDSEKWAQFARSASFPMSWIYRIEAGRLGRYERRAAAECDVVLLVSEAERASLSRDCPDADIRVIANGVDLDYYDPDAVAASGDGRSIVFCGAMDYRSNVDAVCFFHDEILPRVRAVRPDARFRIVGSNPASAVLRLAETPGVTVTGRVPDVRPEILSAAVSVAQMRLGRGVPNKVLEALALTLPVVATTNAAAGIDLTEFEGTDVADDPDSFARAVIDRLEARRYPQHRAVLREKYGWSLHMEKLKEVVVSPRS